MSGFDPYSTPNPAPAPNPAQLQALLYGDDEEQAFRQYSLRKRVEKRYVNEELSARFEGAKRQSLRDLKANPPPAVEWTIERLAARGSITFLLGTFKAGKSWLVVNLLWCLADRIPFLCTYPVRHVDGAIGYFDFEMGVTETYDRLNQIGCVNDHKIFVYDMVAAGFDLMSHVSYDWIKNEINETGMEVIVLDALRHIAQKKDGNNDAEIQAIWNHIERLKKDCPTLQDIFIPTHTAKNDSARPGDDITALGSAAWDGGAQYRWGSYRQKSRDGWKFYFNLLPSRRTDPDAALPREVTMDANGVLSLGTTGSAHAASESERVKGERKNAICAYVRANEPTSKNKICTAVGGSKPSTLKLIDSLHNNELWIEGPDKNPKIWTFQGFLDHLASTVRQP